MMWEWVALEWVTVLRRHDDGTADVRYPDGQQLRIGAWILSSNQW